MSDIHEILRFLPSDLFHEILRFVPVESLSRFRTVCKSWRGIIDNPIFVKSHINRGLGDYWLIVKAKYTDNCKYVFLLSMRDMICRKRGFEYVEAVKAVAGREYDHVERLVPYFPAPACNGLILILKEHLGIFGVVWNPFTGEYLMIPKFEEIRRCGDRGSSCSGIGYDEANDDYKVVRITKRYTFIYSLSMNSWRKIEGLSDSDIDQLSLHGAFAYGALHWIAYSNGYRIDATPDDALLGCVVSFDLSTETYTKIPFPSGIPKINRLCLEVHAVGERLFLSCFRLRERYVLWMLKDYDCENKWVEVLSVMQQDYGHMLRPLAYSDKERQILLYSERVFMWYDVGNQSLERVSLGGNPDSNNGFVHYTFSYQVSPASLVRLKRSHGCVSYKTAPEWLDLKKTTFHPV